MRADAGPPTTADSMVPCTHDSLEAIYYSDDVPAEWAGYVRANVEFFDEPGSPQEADAPAPVTVRVETQAAKTG